MAREYGGEGVGCYPWLEPRAFPATVPNCGAPVEFQALRRAVQTTCPYCQSILVRHDVELAKVGTVADALVDSSPIQLGTEGVFDNKPFVVVGRIVYEYGQGRWNEWHIVFNDSARADGYRTRNWSMPYPGCCGRSPRPFPRRDLSPA